MILLELRYRNVLRLLPASYRAEREEEMVAAYLEYTGDVSDEINPRPSWGEIASVLGLAVRVRLAGAAGAPRAFAWGETVRLIAVFGLAFQSAFAATAVANTLYTLDMPAPAGSPPMSAERLFDIGHLLATALWAAAYVALLRGGVRVAKVSAVLACAYTLVSVFLAAYADWSLNLALVTQAVVPVLALLTGYHRDAPAPSRSWWAALAPLVIGGLGLWGVNLVVFTSFDLDAPETTAGVAPWLDLIGLATVTIVLAGLVCLARARSSAPLLALAALAAVTLLARLPDILQGPNTDPVWMASWNAYAANATLLGVTALVLAVTGLRRLPVLDRVKERSV